MPQYGKVVLKQRSTNGDAVNENLGYVNYDVMNTSVASISAANASLIMAMDGIAALTSNTKITNNVTYDINLADLL